MELDETAVAAEEIEISDEELQKGLTNWRLTLIGCIAGTEVRWANMNKFVHAL